jgi:hypothetical protein
MIFIPDAKEGVCVDKDATCRFFLIGSNLLHRSVVQQLPLRPCLFLLPIRKEEPPVVAKRSIFSRYCLLQDYLFQAKIL